MKKKERVGWICPQCKTINNPESKQCVNKCKIKIVGSREDRINIKE